MRHFHLRMLTVMILASTMAGIAVPLTSASATTAMTTTRASVTSPGSVSDSEKQIPMFWIAPPLITRSIPPHISGVAFDPATPGLVLASVGWDNLLRSVDGGLTWTVLSSWQPTISYMPFHVLYGEQPRTFYMWGANQIYKTTDAGDTWTQLPYGPPCNTIDTLTVHPSQPQVLYAGTRSGFVRSLDGGQTWDSPYMGCLGGLSVAALGAAVDPPNIVYAGRSDYSGGVWRSTDQGANWTNVSGNLPPGSLGGKIPIGKVIVDPRNANVVFAHAAGGVVYKTTNGGAEWTLLQQGVETVALRALFFDDRTFTLYGVSDSQIYYLEDEAQTWQLRKSYPIPQPGSFSYAPKIAVDPHDSDRVIVYHSSGLYVGLPARGQAALPLVLSPR